MESVKSKEYGDRILKRLELRILIVFFVSVLLLVSFLTISILNRTEATVKNNASELIAANSTQLQYNIGSFLNKVETTSALLFSDVKYYKYDATDASLSDYEKIQYKNDISDRIVDLGIMMNFSDFGIIYADDSTVGWVSNATKSIFDPTTIYDEIASYISNEKTKDGWFFGANDNFDRLYYVKRLNENAVLLSSFYTREFANVFELPDELNDMCIRLIDEDNRIMYSSNKDEIGSFVPHEISKYLSGSAKQSLTNDDYIINVNSTENGWRVVCSIPTKVILADNLALERFAFWLAVALVIAFALAAAILFRRMTRPVDSMVSDLEMKAANDGLTGLLNKKSFENTVKEKFNTIKPRQKIAFMILDVDHFKSVNDTFGHAYGDEVITRTADVLKNSFSKNYIIGRIGGDEFAILYIEGIVSLEELNRRAGKKVESLQKAFDKEFESEKESCGLSLSMGIYTANYNGESFEDIYKKADIALYASKQNGRNQFTYYKEGMANEENKES